MNHKACFIVSQPNLNDNYIELHFKVDYSIITWYVIVNKYGIVFGVVWLVYDKAV